MVTRSHVSGTALLLAVAVACGASDSKAQTPIAPIGDELQLNTDTADRQLDPAIAVGTGGDFVVAWRDIRNIAQGTGAEVSARRFQASGAPVGGQFVVNSVLTAFQGYPDVAVLADGSFVVVWLADCCLDASAGGISAQRYDFDGAPAGGEFVVNQETESYQEFPRVAALPGGGFVVVWQSYSDSLMRSRIKGLRYDGSGQTVGTEFQISDGQDGGQYYPTVEAMSGDSFVVAYASYYQDGDDSGVFAKRFDASANQVGTEFQVNTYTTSYQTGPNIAVHDDDSFVVVWVGGEQDGDLDGIFGQRYSPAAQPVGTEFQINQITTMYQGGPDVAGDGQGGFAVAWFNNVTGQQPAASEVAMRQFGADGAPVADEFQVNDFTTDYQSFPRLARIGPQSFMVVWHGFGDEDGDLSGIFARLVGASPACGDGNGDGNRTSTDALIALKTGVGSGNCPLAVCDVNSSGAVNATDGLLILQFAVGQAVQLNCPAV